MTRLISTNPAKNYEVLGEAEISTENEIKEKVQQARQSLVNWRELGVEGRVEELKKLRDGILNKKDQLVLLVTQEMGMPVSQSKADFESAISYFDWYLENASKHLAPEVTFEDETSIHKVFYEPLGVVAAIVPWNFPISNFIWSVIPNLVVGNTVVFKHSEETPLCAKTIEEIAKEAGLPAGVASFIYGDKEIGDSLVHQEIDMICFTGSSKTGKYLYKVAAEKFIRVLLELGGSAPGVVFEDADIDRILESIYFSRFVNCGQACDALKRLIVHESRFDDVVEKLKALVESKKVGDPENEAMDFGPLVTKRQVEVLEDQLQDALDKGAEVITGGKRPDGLEGAFFEPTILTSVTSEMKVWQEEIFGPVLPVVSFKTEEESINLANDAKYGLGGYIFTENKEKAVRIASQIKTGMVSINNAYYLIPSNPFGGAKESGIGREHGKWGLHELCNVKIVSFEK